MPVPLHTLIAGTWFRVPETAIIAQLIEANWESGFASVEHDGKRVCFSPATEVLAVEEPAADRAEPVAEPELPKERVTSRKEVVWRLWQQLRSKMMRKGESPVEQLVAATAGHPKGQVAASMVKQWLKWWALGQRLPGCAKSEKA